MLWMLSAMLLVLWLAAMVSGSVGAWIHGVLVLAIVAVVLALAHRDRYDSF